MNPRINSLTTPTKRLAFAPPSVFVETPYSRAALLDDVLLDRDDSLGTHIHRLDIRTTRAAYELLLKQFKYSWFITLTFRTQSCKKSYAENRLHELSRRLDKRIYGKISNKSREHRVKFVAVLETNSSGAVHWHLLITRPINKPRRISADSIPDVLLAEWAKLDGTGSNNHLKSYDIHHLNYVTKQLWVNDECVYFDWI